MKFNQNPALWTSTILHLVVFVVLSLVTLIEALWPKEQPHVFEMVSEPSPNEALAQNNTYTEPLPDFQLPQVEPLVTTKPEIRNAVVPPSKPEIQNTVVPPSKPVEKPVEPPKEEKLISYEDFRKKIPEKKTKPSTIRPSRPTVTAPTINTEKFSSNLQSSLTTVQESTSSALTAEERTALQRYGDQLNSRLNRAWIKPENLSGIHLVAIVVFDVSRSGQISNIRFSPSSGNASFDESVKAAFASVFSGGPTPTGQEHTFTMSFKMVN